MKIYRQPVKHVVMKSRKKRILYRHLMPLYCNTFSFDHLKPLTPVNKFCTHSSARATAIFEKKKNKNFVSLHKFDFK